MNLEEYLKLGFEYAKNMMISNNDEGAAKYYKGQTDAFKIALDLLKKLEHEVTLREVMNYCEDHMGEYGCDRKCRLYGYFCTTRAGEQPRDWNLIELEKRVREE